MRETHSPDGVVYISGLAVFNWYTLIMVMQLGCELFSLPDSVKLTYAFVQLKSEFYKSTARTDSR